VCSEIFVRSFADSDGDGVGDLEGLIQRLAYVNDGNPDTHTDLRAGCLWLMPIAASPSYHGYDVTDYYRVDPVYGTNADFKRLIEAAHRRGIRVLVDLVVNHVSSEHPYFQDALLHADSPYRDWFLWSDTAGPNNEWGGNNWRKASPRDEYYYGFFWHTMPDLNWETPAVRVEGSEPGPDAARYERPLVAPGRVRAALFVAGSRVVTADTDAPKFRIAGSTAPPLP
jgi:glycosidase